MPDVDSLAPTTSPNARHHPAPISTTDHGAVPTPSSPRQPLPTLRHSPRAHFQRRHSSRLGSFSLNESSTTSNNSSPITASTSASTNLADPPHYPRQHGHSRQPSLGELHQALESESEATVNRLLAQIRDQRAQIEHYQSLAQQQQQTTSDHRSTSNSSTSNRTRQQAPQNPTSSRTPSSSRSRPTSMQPPPPSGHYHQHHPPQPSRQSSLQSVRSARAGGAEPTSYPTSPALTPLESNSYNSVGLGLHHQERETQPQRDEVALTQAEAANVARENLLLKARIRELERAVGEARSMSGDA